MRCANIPNINIIAKTFQKVQFKNQAIMYEIIITMTVSKIAMLKILYFLRPVFGFPKRSLYLQKGFDIFIYVHIYLRRVYLLDFFPPRLAERRLAERLGEGVCTKRFDAALNFTFTI